MEIFHSYVSLPEGMSYYVIVIHDDWMIWGYAHDLGTPHIQPRHQSQPTGPTASSRQANLRPLCEAKDGGSHFDAGDVQYIDVDYVDLDGFGWI